MPDFKVPVMQDFNLRQMPFQLVAEFIRKYCDTIFLPLAVSDHDLIEFKIDILELSLFKYNEFKLLSAFDIYL